MRTVTDYEYTQTLLRPTEAQVLAGAKAMHADWEQRRQRRDPFYSRAPWERIGHDCQAEFINYVRPALEAAWKEEPQ